MLDAALAQLQADPAAAEAAADAFQCLRPICAQLLSLRADPPALTAALVALDEAVQAVPAAGLRRCFDYVTYPLLFMLDAAAAARTLAAGSTAGSSTAGSSTARAAMMNVPAMHQDAAVEALLQVVLSLLQRCRDLERDQVLPLMQQAGTLLQLPRGALPEEVSWQWAAAAAAAAALSRLPCFLCVTCVSCGFVRQQTAQEKRGSHAVTTTTTQRPAILGPQHPHADC